MFVEMAPSPCTERESPDGFFSSCCPPLLLTASGLETEPSPRLLHVLSSFEKLGTESATFGSAHRNFLIRPRDKLTA